MASNIIKANNSDNLDLTTSWVGGVVPGPGDVATWDSTVTGANSPLLNTNLSWSGIQILNPGGAVTIGPANTNNPTLTLGAAGIDLSSQSLTLTTPVALLGGVEQTWNPGAQTLSVNGTLTRAVGSVIRFDTASGGTIHLGGGTASSVLNYATYNGQDVGALDASLNAAAAGSVITYTTNADTSPPSIGAFTYMDVELGSAAGNNGVRITTTTTPVIVRFNAPYQYGNAWVYDVNSRVNYVNQPYTTVLVTTNVGSTDVIFTGTTHVWRFNNASELILDQENPADTLYINGAASARGTLQGGVTKYGPGRAVWNATAPFGGPIIVEAGEFMMNNTTTTRTSTSVNENGTFSGTGTITGPTTDNSGGTIWPGNVGAGTLTVADLTLNSGTALKFYAPSLTTANSSALLDVTGNLTVNGTVNIKIAAGLAVVGTYPLVQWTNAVSPAAFANFTLSQLPLRTTAHLVNNTANHTIDLVVDTVTEPITWTAGSGTWDVNVSANWVDSLSASTTYQEANGIGDAVVFNDTASGNPITITLNSSLVPANVMVNASKDYTLTGAGGINGLGVVTKAGTGTLTLNTANSFSGGLNMNGGIVNFSTLANLGSGVLNFGGGTLQFAAGNTNDISTRTVTFNAGGGTVDDGGNTVAFANPIGNGGAGGFTKTGSGTLTLNGASSYSGNTVVAQGVLALSTNATVSDSPAIVVNSGAVLDTATSGVGLALNPFANQTLTGTGTVNGEVTNGVNTIIEPATGSTYGTLTLGNDLSVEGGTLMMEVSPTNSDLIAVSGGLNLASGILNLTVNGTLANGSYPLISFGSLLSGAGSSGRLTLILSGFNEPGHTAYLNDNATQVVLVVASSASDNLTWRGSGSTWDFAGSLNWLNASTPWAFTNGDFVTFDDSGSAQPSVNLQNAVQPTTVTVNSSANYSFNDGTGVGSGKITGTGNLVKSGTGTLTINTVNDNSGGTTINSGTVQVSGDIGVGNIANNGALVFAQTTSRSVPGQISGNGSLTQQGSGTLTLEKDNPYSGPTTISSGALELGNGLISSGTIGTGNVTNNGTLILNHLSGSYSLPNPMTGSGALTKIGGGSVTLGGGLTYQGNTSISNGVVILSADGQLPNANNTPGSTGWLILDGGATAGTVDLAGHSQTVNALSGLAGTVTGVITNSGTTGTNSLNILGAAATTYSGVINENPTGAKIQLNLSGTNTLTLAVANSYSGGTVLGNGSSLAILTQTAFGTGPVTMNDGASLNLANGGSPFQNPTVPITTVPGATANFTSGNLGNTYAGPFIGDSTTTNVFTGPVSWHGENQFDNFYGTARLEGDPALNEVRVYAANDGSTNMTMDMQGGNLYVRDGGDVVTFGALSGTGLGIINGGGTYIIGGKGVNSDYPGTIGGSLSLVKDGAGTLTFNGGTNIVIGLDPVTGDTVTNYILTNMVVFTGTVTVSNGVLALDAPINFNDTLSGNPSAFTLAGDNAVLDLSSMGYTPDNTNITSDSTLVVAANSLGTNQVLAGFGTIRGSVNASSAVSTVAVGLPMGVLSVTNSIELGGAVTMNVSADATHTNNSELVSPTITVDSTATLTVTNLGSEVLATFQLFNHPVNFTSGNVHLPTLSGTNHWIDNLSVDGSITLVAPVGVPVDTNSVPIHYTQSGGNLNLSWPPNHEGWRLQTQTNSPGVGLSTNWVNVAGSTTTTQMSFTIGATNGSVFYRMVYP